MNTRQNPAAPAPKPPAPKPTTPKEAEGTRVKQGTENAPEDGASLVPKGETTTVRGADGRDIEVNVDAQNTTQTLENQRAIDENPATKALRDQEERLAMQGLVQNDALVTAVEQGRQQEYLIEKGLIDDPNDPEGKKKDRHGD